MGIHARPSAAIVKEAKKYEGEIVVTAESGTCDPTSALAVISLGLHEGAQVRVRVTGPDEEAWCKRMVALFETHFDFPPRKEGEQVDIPSDLL